MRPAAESASSAPGTSGACALGVMEPAAIPFMSIGVTLPAGTAFGGVVLVVLFV